MGRGNCAISASVSGAVLVGVGAFGAHALKLSDDMDAIYQTGVSYHAYHTLAILAAVAIAPLWRGSAVRWACGLWLAGIVLFSGSLYALAVTDISKFGMITPLGGVTFIAGWIALGIACFQHLPIENLSDIVD